MIDTGVAPHCKLSFYWIRGPGFKKAGSWFRENSEGSTKLGTATMPWPIWASVLEGFT